MTPYFLGIKGMFNVKMTQMQKAPCPVIWFVISKTITTTKAILSKNQELHHSPSSCNSNMQMDQLKIQKLSHLIFIHTQNFPFTARYCTETNFLYRRLLQCITNVHSHFTTCKAKKIF